MPSADLELEWTGWISEDLLSSLEIGRLAGIKPSGWLGFSTFTAPEGVELVLRHGPRDGFAVDPTGELRRSPVTPGPFYLLDIDSYWVPDGDIPEFARDEIIGRCDLLHAPIDGLFESLITEQLRREVLRKNRQEGD